MKATVQTASVPLLNSAYFQAVLNVLCSDLGTWESCPVAHSAGLTRVLSHHLFLNWWSERRLQICAYNCLGFRCTLGLVLVTAMLASSLPRHLEESEKIQANCTWPSQQMEKRACILQRAADQLLRGVYLPSINRCSSFAWHCGKDPLTWIFSPYPLRVTPH